ncbi:sensor histidine kinase [Enterococcus canis]|nr:ATP-binding protein [Enterococcus canis]
MKKRRLEYILVILMMGLLLIGSVWFTNHFFRQETINQQENYLERKIELLEDQLDFSAIFTDQHLTADQERLIETYLASDDERLTLIDQTGEIFFDSTNPALAGARNDRPEVQAVFNGASFGSSLRYSETLKADLLYLAQPIRHNGTMIGVIRLSEEVSQFSQNIRTFRQYIILTLGLLFTVITGFILLLIRQKNQPLLTVLPVLKNILQQPEKERSIIQYSPEWQELYETINDLSHQMTSTYKAFTTTDEQFHALLDELMIGVFIVDTENNVVLLNPKMRELLGITSFQQQNFVEVFRDLNFVRLIQQTIADHQTLHEELTLQNGFVLDLSLRYIEPNDVNHYQVLGIAYDLTRVRQLESVQRDFVSNVSHELKTPVTSLLGFTETLLDGAKDDPETLTQFLEIMQKDAHRLQRLIQEILQLSRDGRQTFTTQKLDLPLLLAELTTAYQKVIQEKHLTIQIEGPQPLFFITQYELFYPILKNLFENALQYSRNNGTVTISYQLSETALDLSVSDEGIGIELEDQERIFERFYRVDKARSRHSGGTGLGLAIVQNYTELLGGEVSVESHLGLGSTFSIRLPIKKETSLR